MQDIDVKEKRTTNFIRERLLSLFDNIIAYVVLIGLGIAIPAIVGFVLKLEIQLILLIILLLGQVFGLFLLFGIQRKLSNTKTEKQIIVQNTDTSNFYLIDDFGLPHLINDDNTALYFIEILGYKPNEVPKVSASKLKPVGASIISIRDWRPPRTIQDNMSAEARESLKIMSKYVRAKSAKKVISFNLRNDNTQVIEINSARLVFDSDAPITVADISAKNEPKIEGLLGCKLLFDGKSKSKSLLPQKEYRLDLFLDRELSEKDMNRIITSRFGYIEVKGLFRDTEVYLHLYV